MKDMEYIINTDRAISETLDNETIIINLDTGNYYSMNETATALWEQLQSHASLESLLDFFVTHYTESPTVLAKAITETLHFLIKENLIIETDTKLVRTPTASVATKEAFIIPKIEKYEDMQQMLLADPIHDVDAGGWPILKKEVQ